MIKLSKTFIKYILMLLNLKVILGNIKRRNGINLNIGSGSYEINGFISLDYYSQHYYKNQRFNKIHYDMRNDKIPFNSEMVDTIYCSHVVEHVETEYVLKFIEESFRVLKVGGVLRIVCPDSFFLYRAMKDFPDYYSWHPMFRESNDASICFVDEVADHRKDLINFGLDKLINDYKYEELMDKLREGGEFKVSNPGRHINSWDFERLRKFGLIAGFTKVIESRYKASSCFALQGFDMDLSHPEMSLYVDFIK